MRRIATNKAVASSGVTRVSTTSTEHSQDAPTAGRQKAIRASGAPLRAVVALLKGSGCLCEDHEVMGEDAEDDFAALRLAVPSGQG
jgi:hypothetical protein